MILVVLTTVNPDVGWVPKATPVAPANPVPVMVTTVAPVLGPALGASLVTFGIGGVVYVYFVAALAAEMPPGVVTRTSTIPTAPAGAVAVTLLLLTTVNPAAGRVPKVTPVAPANPEPVTVTTVPPKLGPDLGDNDEIEGAAACTVPPAVSPTTPVSPTTNTTNAATARTSERRLHCRPAKGRYLAPTHLLATTFPAPSFITAAHGNRVRQ